MDRLPPQEIEMEMAALGSMMLEKEAVATAITLLREDDFYKQSHGKIFSAISNLFMESMPVDLLTVSESLSQSDILESVGGKYYLTELIERIPSAANIEYYCDSIKAKSGLRKLITISSEIQKQCYESDADPIKIIELYQSDLFKSIIRNKCDYECLKDVLPELLDVIEKAHASKKSHFGIMTGFEDIDKFHGGLQGGDLIFMAAITSNGKTALALNIARNIARRNEPVAIVSLEMNIRKLAMRILGTDARIDSMKAKFGQLDENEFERISESFARMYQYPIYIDDQRGQTILEIKAKAKRAVMRYGIKLLIIDQIGLIDISSKYYNRNIELGTVSQGLKSLAGDLDIPILALHQLSRNIQKGKFRFPQLADLYESGHIEQDADIVWFISRPELHEIEEIKIDEKKYNTKDLAIIKIAKNRDGQSNKFIPMIYNKEYTEFVALNENQNIETEWKNPF